MNSLIRVAVCAGFIGAAVGLFSYGMLVGKLRTIVDMETAKIEAPRCGS